MNPRLLRPRASGYVAKDADARAYISSVQTADGSKLEPAVAKAIDDFVAGCKTDGIWTAIKASCILMGARTLSGALTPLAGPSPTNNGPFASGDYDRKTGLLGNGSTKYLDTGRADNASPQNSNHISAYVSSAPTASGCFIGGGGAVGSAFSQLFGSTTFALGPRNRDSGSTTIGSSALVGFAANSRSASGSHLARVNGASQTVTVDSQSPSANNIFAFARNNNGTAGSFLSARLAFYSIGEAIDIALLDTRVSSLYAAISAALAPKYADADVNAYINAVEAADGQMLETSVRDAINTFITGCKSDGIWSAIKASCILMGARTLSGALTPLVGTAPTNVNFVSGDYNRKTGLIGDGSTKYLNTNRNLSTSDSQDSHHAAVLPTVFAVESALSASDFGPMIAARASGTAAGAVQALHAGPNGGTPNLITFVSTNAGFTAGKAAGTLAGLSRSASGSFVQRHNGSSTTNTDTSQSLANTNWLVFARTVGGSGEKYTTTRLGFYSIGESLTLSSLDTRVSALYTAIGAAIP
jgi:hypothetical protein